MFEFTDAKAGPLGVSSSHYISFETSYSSRNCKCESRHCITTGRNVTLLAQGVDIVMQRTETHGVGCYTCLLSNTRTFALTKVS